MSALYTPEMLALSAQLSRYPWSNDFSYQAHARSSVCGSTLSIGIDRRGGGQIERIGMKVSACAVGQSSAAILAEAIEGQNPQEISATLEGIRGWLTQGGDLPTWPGLATIAGALKHPGRHGALLLPWEAAVKALSAKQ